MPRRLSAKQKRAWGEITDNPALGRVDESLLYDYIETVGVAETAAKSIAEKGVLLSDDRVNPACRVYNQAKNHLLTLRKIMLLTPRARAELKAARVVQPAPNPHAKPRKRKWGVTLD